MINNIVQLLVNQKNNLTSLVNTAMSKQKALINFNHIELENAISNEEKLLLAVQQCEQKRIEAIKDFYSKQSLNYETYRLSEFCKKTNSIIGENNINKISVLEKQIRTAINQINKLNQKNIFLIEHSRSFIKDTITALINANKSFLDKRV